MMNQLTKALAGLAAVAALAWVGPRQASAKDWMGPYDSASGRWYAEEERDYAAWQNRSGVSRDRGYRPSYYSSYAGGAAPAAFRYAAYEPSYSYGAPANGAAAAASNYSDDYDPRPAAGNTAHVRVIVPADARVWFGNSATRQTGPVRHFESPELTPGKGYAYEVTARWTEGGKDVTRTRHVDVRANSSATVDFARP
jgi:uncharacterized protein (TIGR03000 family)